MAFILLRLSFEYVKMLDFSQCRTKGGFLV